MGITHSNLVVNADESIKNDLMLKFIGVEHIPLTDPFWAQFLSCSLKPPSNRLEEDAFMERIKPVCVAMTSSNLKTANFTTMLQYLMALCQELRDSVDSSKTVSNTIQWQCFNGLFISRCYAKYLVLNAPEGELVRQFNIEATPQDKLEGEMRKEDTKPLLERFVSKLVNLVYQLPLTETTYNIHFETTNNLLTLLSTQMFTTTPANQLEVYRIMMENEHAKALTFSLVDRIVHQTCPPSNSNSSILIGLASDLWSLLWKSSNYNEIEAHLTTHSVIILLILVNHCAGPNNPYRQALSSYDRDLAAVYKSLCSTIHREENTLLLYHLLHVNQNFKTFLLAQTDIENLVIPLLKVVYNNNNVEKKCHHIYMSLIILLILTEDPLFNKTVHNTFIKSVPWYSERVLPEISLGGLIILVTTRTVQYNLLRTRDKYLHTNCLAALANMSAQFTNLHPYVCQRILGLFEILAKTYSRGNGDSTALEEALRIVLEVINSCLAHQLVQNTNLVYTLLYKKEIFEPFRGHEAFSDVVKNIDLVINYFTNKLSSEESIDVDEVLAKVQFWAVQWPRELIDKFPDLKFKYVEDDKPEEFFIPYVWSLVEQETLMSWEASVYKLT
nr:PREDICTED: dymeclin [Bemisia tabaci]